MLIAVLFTLILFALFGVTFYYSIKNVFGKPKYSVAVFIQSMLWVMGVWSMVTIFAWVEVVLKAL